MSWSGKFKNGESFSDLTDDELEAFADEINVDSTVENVEPPPASPGRRPPAAAAAPEKPDYRSLADSKEDLASSMEGDRLALKGLTAKLKRDDPEKYKMRPDLAEEDARVKLNLKGVSFSGITNYRRTKAGGKESALSPVGDAIRDSEIGKAFATLGSTIFGEGPDAPTKAKPVRPRQGPRQFRTKMGAIFSRAPDVIEAGRQEAEGRRAQELMDVEESVKADAEMAAIIDQIKAKEASGEPLTGDEHEALRTSKDWGRIERIAKETGTGIGALLQQAADDPAYAARELGLAMTNPVDLALMAATMGTSSVASGLAKSGSVMAKGYRAGQAASKAAKVIRPLGRFAGEAVVQGVLSEGMHTGDVTATGTVMNTALAAGMQGAASAIPAVRAGRKWIERKMSGRQIGDGSTATIPEPSAPPVIDAPPAGPTELLPPREPGRRQPIRPRQSLRRPMGEHVPEAETPLTPLESYPLAGAGAPPVEAPAVVPEALPPEAPIPDPVAAPEPLPAQPVIAEPPASALPEADLPSDPPPYVKRKQAARKAAAERLPEPVDPKAVEAKKAEAKTTLAARYKESQAAAARGDKDLALKMLDESDFDVVFDKDAPDVRDSYRRHIESIEPKPESVPVVGRAESVAEANANLEAGIQKIDEAATPAQVDAVEKAYQQPAKDVGKPKRLRQAATQKKAQLEAAKPVRPRAPAPEAAAPAATAAAPEPSRKREIVIPGKRPFRIPTMEDVAQSPAEGALDIVQTLRQLPDPEDGWSGLTQQGRLTLSDPVMKAIQAAAPTKAAGIRMVNAMESLLSGGDVVSGKAAKGARGFSEERVAALETLSEREMLADAASSGDAAATKALEEFDVENGMQDIDEATGLTKLEKMRIDNELSPAEWGVVETFVDLLNGRKARTAGVGQAAIVAAAAVAPFLDQMFGADAANSLMMASFMGASMDLNPVTVGRMVMDAMSTPVDEIGALAHSLKKEGKAAASEAAFQIAKTARAMVSHLMRQQAAMFGLLRSARNRIPSDIWREQRREIAKIVRGERDASGLDPRVADYAAAVRKVLDDLRYDYRSVTGRQGRNNYLPRIVDHKKLRTILDDIYKRVDADKPMDPTTLANAREQAVTSTFSQQTESAIAEAVKDMKKGLRIKNGVVEADIGPDSDLPGSLLQRPEADDGTFLPPHLPDIFAPDAADGVVVKPNVKMSDADLDAMLRREAIRMIHEMWDPDDPMTSSIVSRAQKARRWQMDGSLIHRRMMPHLGDAVYVDDIEDIMAHVIDRQTRGVNRIRYFGESREWTPDEKAKGDLPPMSVSHKKKLEGWLKTLANEGVDMRKLGLVQEGRGVRLASSTDREVYMQSMLRGIEDVAMGYMRPFSERTKTLRILEGAGTLGKTLGMTLRSLNAAANEMQSLGQSVSVGGTRSLGRYVRARGEVARRTAIENTKTGIASGLDLAGRIPGLRRPLNETAAWLRDNGFTQYYLERGAGDASGRMGMDRVGRTLSAMNNLFGTFGPSNLSTDFAASAAGYDLALDGLEAIKDLRRSATWRTTKAGRKLLGDSPEGELAEMLRETVGDEQIEKALTLVGENGAPMSEQALEELYGILGPFVDDYRSKVTGSSEALFQSKLFRNRWFKNSLGLMASVPLAIASRMMHDVANQPTVARKIRTMGRHAVGTTAAGAGMTAVATSPVLAAIAAATMNGAIVPMAMTGVLLAGHPEMADDPESFKSFGEKRADITMPKLSESLNRKDYLRAASVLSGMTMRGLPYMWQPAGAALEGTSSLLSEAMGAGFGSTDELAGAGGYAKAPADMMAIGFPGISIPLQIMTKGIRRARAEEGFGDAAKAFGSAIPMVNDVVGPYWDARGKRPTLSAKKGEKRVEGILGAAEAGTLSPAMMQKIRTGMAGALVEQ